MGVIPYLSFIFLCSSLVSGSLHLVSQQAWQNKLSNRIQNVILLQREQMFFSQVITFQLQNMYLNPPTGFWNEKQYLYFHQSILLNSSSDFTSSLVDFEMKNSFSYGPPGDLNYFMRGLTAKVCVYYIVMSKKQVKIGENI